MTEGPSPESREVGRAQGIYANSQLDGKVLHGVLGDTHGRGVRREHAGDSGADVFGMKEREFGIVSGTGYFRFVSRVGVMETEFVDLANLRATLKLNVTVKHH